MMRSRSICFHREVQWQVSKSLSLDGSALNFTCKQFLSSYLSCCATATASSCTSGSGCRNWKASLHWSETWIRAESGRIVDEHVAACTERSQNIVCTGGGSIAINCRCIVSRIIIAEVAEYNRRNSCLGSDLGSTGLEDGFNSRTTWICKGIEGKVDLSNWDLREESKARKQGLWETHREKISLSLSD